MYIRPGGISDLGPTPTQVRRLKLLFVYIYMYIYIYTYIYRYVCIYMRDMVVSQVSARPLLKSVVQKDFLTL